MLAVRWGTAVAEFSRETNWRISFERFTSLPSGVTPVFPVFFLALTFAFGVFFQLAGRRLYRLSYLSSELQDAAALQNAVRYDRILLETRKKRTEVDKLITQLPHAVRETKLWIKIAVGFLILHVLVRCGFRGWPRSLETRWFDWLYWPIFSVAFLFVLVRALQLATLWQCVRQMLHRAIQLPLSHAYDRMPARFKTWFFGEDDFSVREHLILQQSHALRNRCSSELADIFQKIEKLTSDQYKENFFVCRPTDDASGAGVAAPSVWHAELEVMRKGLKESSTLDSTRTVYPFLRPLWESRPIEDVPKASSRRRDVGRSTGLGRIVAADTMAAREAQQPRRTGALRDWTRMAEDLIALQIVRWFAPRYRIWFP